MLTYKVGQPIFLEHEKKAISKADFSKFASDQKIFGKPKSNPKVTVQVTAYNEGEDLIKCLDSIVSQTYKDFEIVLVDNGLDQRTKEALKDFDLVYVDSSENVGCSHGRNIGAAYSSGELIAFIDADGYIESNYLQLAVDFMKDKSITAVRGKVLPYENSVSVPGHYDLGEKVVPSLISTEGNSVWRLKDYKKVGGFENSLAGGEGLALCYRMHSIYGYDKDTFTYTPELVLYHDFHSSKSHLQAKLYKQAIIRNNLHKKYPMIYMFEEYYRRGGARPKETRDSTIGDVAERTKAKVWNEYSKLYEKKRQDRINNPELVKGQKSYDFTVVIPCYNLGALAKLAVASVQKQSIDSVQIIIVDDVSTDEETVDVLKELEAQVEVVYLKKNGGVANARNQGIKRAKSDYILCLDADDTIEPGYLEKAYNSFKIYKKAGIITTWARYFGAVKGEWKVKEDISLVDALVASPVPTASCFRKKAWEEVGGYESRMRGYEDWELWVSIIEKGWQVEVIPEFNFNYFVRKDGKVKTSNKNSEALFGRIYDNHQQSYQKHLKEVLAVKHKEAVSLRATNNRLQNQTFKTVLLNTPLAGPLRVGKKALLRLARLFRELRRARSIREALSLIYHFFRSAMFKIRRKIFRS